MHVAKVSKIKNTFDNTFKNLRGRKVPYRESFLSESSEDHIPLPAANDAPNSKLESLDHQRQSNNGGKLPKKSNSRLHSKKLAERLPMSFNNSLDGSLQHSVVQKPEKRKSNRKKIKSRLFSPEHTRRSLSRSVCSLDKYCSSTKTPERAERRSCRKKNSELLWEGVLATEVVDTNSKRISKSIIKLEPDESNIDECCAVAVSPEKPKKRAYHKKKFVQKLKNIDHTEPKRRSRSLCTLGCCNSLSSTPEMKKKRKTYRRKSLYTLSITASPQDDQQLLQPSVIYQRDGFVPTSQVVVEFRKKRIYRKKGVSDVISMERKKKPKISLLNFVHSKSPSATVVVDIFKKRTYRKKNSDLLTDPPNTWPRSKISVPDLSDDNATFTPVKMTSQCDDIPGHATMLEPLENDTEINFSQSTITASQTSDNVVQHQIKKRGRGRPRKISIPAVEACPVVGTDDELTCTCSSTLSTATKESQPGRRSRKKRWPWEDDEEDPVEEEVSEYELMIRRNIEENKKMLRQIFMDQGLDFEEKSSDTPKIRKSYTKPPPPPPRPKSARIEVKRSSSSLDFSKFCHNHTIL